MVRLAFQALALSAACRLVAAIGGTDRAPIGARERALGWSELHGHLAHSATAKRIGPNKRYWERLVETGLLEVPAALTAGAPADPWNTTGFKGVNYIPSYAHNSIETWMNYSHAAVSRELGYGAAAGTNAVRVVLHWAVWAYNATYFTSVLDDFLATAAANGMKAVLAVFDGTGGGDPQPSWIASGQYIGQGWLSGPGLQTIQNASALPVLDAYIAALVARYGNDARVVGWDAMHQPILGQTGVYAFLQRYSKALFNGVNSKTAFTTITIIPGGAACDSTDIPLDYQNVISFENFNGNEGAIAGDTQGVQGCAASIQSSRGPGAAPLPVVLTGTMTRTANPPQGLCDCRFEASGQGWINIPQHPQIGLFVNYLMLGVNEWSQGPIPDAGLIWPNGTWYDATEQQCWTAAVAPVPPPPPGPPAPVLNFTAGGLKVGIRGGSRAIQFLGLVNDTSAHFAWAGNFSFVPPLWNFLPGKPHRQFPGCHHIGDLTLRVQPVSETNASSWATYSSSHGGDAVASIPLPNMTNSIVIDAADITPPLNAGGQIDTRYSLGLQVIRTMELADAAGDNGFRIRWNITNTNSSGVRIGGLGFSLISDAFFGGINLTQIAYSTSFMDPFIGGGRSWVGFTRTDGSRSMLVTPCTPAQGSTTSRWTQMEAWRPVFEDAAAPDAGTFEWSAHTYAWAQEWVQQKQTPDLTFSTDPTWQAAWPNPRSPWPSWHLAETVYSPNQQLWNTPTYTELAAGESADYCLQFSLPPQVSTFSQAPGGPRDKDAGLLAVGQPALVGVPGYVLGTDMATAALYVTLPAGLSLSSVTSLQPSILGVGPSTGNANATRISLLPLSRGRAALQLNYSDGSWSNVQFYVTEPLSTVMQNYGYFASTVSWLNSTTFEPFGRSSSFMPWDREDNVHVLQDARPFVVGLSDDAGGGAILGISAKVSQAPTALEASRIDGYIARTLIGVKDASTAIPPFFSLQDPTNDRILMTTFYFYAYNAWYNQTNYYQELDKCTIAPSWCAFNSPPPSNPPKWIAEYRAFNFPHQISSYWTLYLLSRNYDQLAASIPLAQSWDWYLQRAVDTLLSMSCYNVQTGTFTCNIDVGLMDGTVFREVLKATTAEGWTNATNLITEIMYQRCITGVSANDKGWVSSDLPAGSEFSWDTTGQEEVGVWGAWFNATDAGLGELNARLVDTILAYQPSVPNWAYNGAAYGMGDMSNNAKWMVTGGWEREGGHYRAGLNSIPVIERYRTHPDDFYLLQVGAGGIANVLPNINEQGAASMAFHLHPMVLQHDPNSGDSGLGLFGSTMNAGSYLHFHPSLGPLCFFCDASITGSGDTTVAVITPRDAYAKRVFVQPLGLWMVAEAGQIANVTVDMGARTATIVFMPAATPLNASISGGALAAAAQYGNVPALPAPAPGVSARPFTYLRLHVEQSAPTDRNYAFKWVSPPDGQLVRDAYQFSPAADDTAVTVAVVGW